MAHPSSPVGERNALRLPALVVLALFGVALAWSAHAVFVRGDVSVYDENGPLESLQALLLALACAGFLSPRAARTHDRLVLLFFALLCFAFTLTELDVERFAVPAPVKLLGAGDGRNVMLALGFLAWIVYALRHFGRSRRAWLAFLGSASGILLMSAAPFLFAGRVFEESHSILHHAWWEEIAELAGDSLIVLAAWAANLRAAPARRDAGAPGRSEPVNEASLHGRRGSE